MCKVNAVKIRGGERARERERERERDSTRVERVCPTPCISTPWLHVSPMCHPMCHPICTTMSLPMCHPILTRSLSIQNASTALSPSKRRVYVKVGWTIRTRAHATCAPSPWCDGVMPSPKGETQECRVLLSPISSSLLMGQSRGGSVYCDADTQEESVPVADCTRLPVHRYQSHCVSVYFFGETLTRLSEAITPLLC